METCKNCRHWGVSASGICDRVEYISEKFDPKKFTAVVYTSGHRRRHGESYCILFTGPEFGCVLFEPQKERDNENL